MNQTQPEGQPELKCCEIFGTEWVIAQHCDHEAVTKLPCARQGGSVHRSFRFGHEICPHFDKNV